MGTKNLNSATNLITFTRASGGTALRKISYGNELVTNGNGTTTAGWTTSGAAIFTSDGSEFFVGRNGSGVTQGARQAGILTTGKVYKVTADIISLTNTFSIYMGAGTVEAEAKFTVVGLGQVRYVTATGADLFIQATAAGGATATIDNISVKEVLYDQPDGTLQLFNSPANVPRIEYDATGAVKGLLIEEARTNLVTYSNNLTGTGWLNTLNSNTANAGVSPDGTSNANKVVPTVSSGVHYTYKTLNFTNADHSFSVYVASAGYGFATICAGTTHNNNYYAVVIDLSNGTQTALYSSATHSKTVTVEPVGSFYRVTISGDGEKYYVVGASDTGTYTPSNYGFKSFQGDGTSGILVYGAQAEAGAFPTSYIPTTGSTATRARDLAEIPTSAFGHNNDHGSLVIDVLTPVADQFTPIAYFNTSSFYNSRGFVKSNTNSTSLGPHYVLTTYDGASTKIQLGTQTQAEYTKLGLSYGDNESGVKDGGTVLSGTSRYPNPTRLYLGGRDNGYQSQCWIKSIQYYPRRLTNTQLQELTT